MDREKVMQALFERVSGAAKFATTSRRLRIWSDIPSSEKPALFLIGKGSESQRDSNHITLLADIYIYLDTGKNSEEIPETVMNYFIDSVSDCLAPNSLTGLQTLGGLAVHCWIEGKILQDSGDLDGDGVAVIPVKILIPTKSLDNE